MNASIVITWARPQIAQVVISPFDTLRTAWTSLLRGEVDMVTDVPHDAVEFVPEQMTFEVDFIRSSTISFWSPSTLEDLHSTSPDVRRALNTAVDRESVDRKRASQGAGEPATGPLWPQHWAYDASVQPYRFDPDGAVASLESRGISRCATTSDSLPPARLRLSCLPYRTDFSLLERIGLEVQKQLYDIGVDMQFEVVPIQEFDTADSEKASLTPCL